MSSRPGFCGTLISTGSTRVSSRSALKLFNTLLAILPWLQSGRASPPAVKVIIDSRRPRSPDTVGLHTLEFCLACPDPHLEGSQILALGAVHGPAEYRVAGELAFVVPNDASMKRLLNPEELRGRVALVNRGQVPLVDKILAVQRAGAVGVIIADDGNCTGNFECGRVGSARDGGFSKRDPWQSWREVKIPSLLVMEDVGDRLKKMLTLEKINIPGVGEQFIQRL